MPFIESPRFPDLIGYGSGGGPVYETRVITTSAGYEQRNQQNSYPLRMYDLTHAAKTRANYEVMLSFFLAVSKGMMNGFRIKDPHDYAALVTAGLLGTAGAGTGYATYQLYKQYTSGAYTHPRAIRKLVSGTLAVYRAAVLQTAGAGAGQYSVDATTGIVTYVADGSVAISTHTPGASHVFTTATDLSMLAIGEKVYLTGVTGTGATTLNSLVHTISNKTGSGPYTWTISTATTGLTTASGTVYAYPQAGEALTASFQFDTPVRLDGDEFLADVIGPQLLAPRRLVARELRIAL